MTAKAFDRIFIIMLENETETKVLDNQYMRALAARGVTMSQYFGVTHPSQPNYIASAAGSTFGIASDNCYNIDATNVVDLLEAKNVTWRAYMEDLPANKATCIYNNLYYRKHNPFISFDNIRNNPVRAANVVNAAELQADIDKNALPEYCWYTPNIQNDGHTVPADFEPHNPNRNVNFIAQWLQGFLEPLLVNPKFIDGTLVVVTFDESIPYDANHITRFCWARWSRLEAHKEASMTTTACFEPLRRTLIWAPWAETIRMRTGSPSCGIWGRGSSTGPIIHSQWTLPPTAAALPARTSTGKKGPCRFD
jgi:hypothetical protein